MTHFCPLLMYFLKWSCNYYACCRLCWWADRRGCQVMQHTITQWHSRKKSGAGLAILSTTHKFPGKMSILESHMSHLGKWDMHMLWTWKHPLKIRRWIVCKLLDGIQINHYVQMRESLETHSYFQMDTTVLLKRLTISTLFSVKRESYII